MKRIPRNTALALPVLLCLAGCDPTPEQELPLPPQEEIGVIQYSFRDQELLHQRDRISDAEAKHRDCAPGAEYCDASVERTFGGEIVERRAAPFQAQITAPAEYTINGNPVAADDWEERHFCGASLIAPNWVVTAAHCMHQNMIARGFRVRLGISNLALDEGKAFPITEVICFDPAYCEADQRPSFPYKDDIALVRFEAEPGDLVLASDNDIYFEVNVEEVEVSADGNSLTTWTSDGTVRRWNMASGAELSRRPREQAAPPRPAASNPQVIDIDAMQARRWSREDIDLPGTGQRLSSRYISDANGGPLRSVLTLASTREEDRRIPAYAEIGELQAMRAAPDNSYLVTIEKENGFQIRSWKAGTLDQQWSLRSQPALELADYPRIQISPQILDLSPDGALLGDADTVMLIDPQSGDIRRRFTHPRSEAWESVRARATAGARNLIVDGGLTDDGNRLLTVTQRYGGSDVWLWNAATGRMLQRFPHEEENLGEYAEGARLLSTGRLFSWTQFGTMRLWDSESGEALSIMEQGLSVQQLAFFDGDRKVLVSDAAGGAVWDLESGEKIAQIDHLDVSYGSTLSPDESTILSWSMDGTARLWSAETGEELRRIYHAGMVNGATFTRNGEQILSWSSDGTVRLTDVADGHTLMNFDIARFPIDSELAPPADQLPPQPAEIGYLHVASPADGPFPGELVEIYGWGKTIPVAGFVPYASLMKVQLEVMDNADCAAREDFAPELDEASGKETIRIHEDVFCASDDYQKTCKGDSGGPVINYKSSTLVGLVSWGKSLCGGTGEPGVYTRIANYRDWIVEHIGEENLPAFPAGVDDRVIGGAVL